MRALIHGCGYSGEAFARRLTANGWLVAGTSRSPERREALARAGVIPVDPADAPSLDAEARGAQAVLVASPPDAQGCPGLRTLGPALAQARPRWLAYLSTTGVYGDRGGRWVDEDSALDARSPEAARRVAAEAGWRALAEAHGLALTVMRLPGIYGPGRSPFARLRAGRGERRDKPGQVFSRIHVDDLAEALACSLARPAAAPVFNVCDDRPAASALTTAYAARLLGLEPPPLQPFDADALSPLARRFWSESKRVSNARAKAALSWRPAYPSYVEGFAAVLAAERGAAGGRG